MSRKFLNFDTPQEGMVRIGASLKTKSKQDGPRPNPQAVAKAAETHGFTRSTGPAPIQDSQKEMPRRGRPPLNEAMTYWRIYIREDLRTELNALRDKEGRRLNDLLADMLDSYKSRDQ